jgi:WD40 repeat protein
MLRSRSPTGIVEEGALSPAGDIAALAFNDGSIELFDVNSGEARRRLIGHVRTPLALAFSEDGRFLASAGSDESLRLWDVENEVLIAAFPHKQLNVLALAWHGPGEVRSYGTNGSLRRWRVPYAQISQAELSQLQEHSPWMLCGERVAVRGLGPCKPQADMKGAEPP